VLDAWKFCCYTGLVTTVFLCDGVHHEYFHFSLYIHLFFSRITSFFKAHLLLTICFSIHNGSAEQCWHSYWSYYPNKKNSGRFGNTRTQKFTGSNTTWLLPSGNNKLPTIVFWIQSAFVWLLSLIRHWQLTPLRVIIIFPCAVFCVQFNVSLLAGNFFLSIYGITSVSTFTQRWMFEADEFHNYAKQMLDGFTFNMEGPCLLPGSILHISLPHLMFGFSWKVFTSWSSRLLCRFSFLV
jgi:hypothetical protein